MTHWEPVSPWLLWPLSYSHLSQWAHQDVWPEATLLCSAASLEEASPFGCCFSFLGWFPGQALWVPDLEARGSQVITYLALPALPACQCSEDLTQVLVILNSPPQCTPLSRSAKQINIGDWIYVGQLGPYVFEIHLSFEPKGQDDDVVALLGSCGRHSPRCGIGSCSQEAFWPSLETVLAP